MNSASNNRLAVLAAEIRTAHEDAHRSAEYSARRACDAGERLMEARDSQDIPFGGYERWVKQVVGIPPDTAAHYIRIFCAIKERGLTASDIAEASQKGVLRMLREQEAEARRALSGNAPKIVDGMNYRVGDCRVVLSDVEDNSIPLILTDPPYALEADPLYEWLAEFAARVLIPGGSLICYTGHARVNRDIWIFDAHLDHHCPCIMPLSPEQRILGMNVMAGHRPIHWYTKGTRRSTSMMPTVFVSAGPDKLAHPWAQGDGGVWIPIEHLTEPGETILDPCAGTGEWGRIAVEMGRRWKGADIALGGNTTVAV